MKETKRQVLPCGLWIVATPIGNLGDITYRAVAALTDADFILCEDTRRTAVLLSALGIREFKPRLERLDSYTQPKQLQKWVESLKTGKNLALVSDAGTPAISDPGSALVAYAREAGVAVIPVPGVSSVSALLSISGFEGTAFTFRGFFPRKRREQKDELEKTSACSFVRIYIWFESPIRIVESLNFIRENFPEVLIIAAKELTKFHERVFWGTAALVSERVQEEIQSQGTVGEWCFALQFSKHANSSPETDWMKALKCLIDAKISVSEAAKRVSQTFDISKKDSYRAALALSNKKVKEGVEGYSEHP